MSKGEQRARRSEVDAAAAAYDRANAAAAAAYDKGVPEAVLKAAYDKANKALAAYGKAKAAEARATNHGKSP
jgi:hypothetical protein